MMIETVETVLTGTMAANTQLKQVVNEMGRGRKNLRCTLVSLSHQHAVQTPAINLIFPRAI